MKRKILNNKGSSFAYVLVVLLVLTILTASLITATVTNYRLGLLKGGRNTAFYFNDGAIEEALAEIEELSHRAEVSASNIVQSEHADFKNAPEWIKFERWLERKMKLADDVEGHISQEDASDYYEKALRKEFDKQYLLYLLDNASVHVDYTLIDDEEEFVEANDMVLDQGAKDGLDAAYLKQLEIVSFTPADFSDFDEVAKPTLTVTSDYLEDSHEIKLTIQSDGTYSIYHKQLEVVLRMQPPAYEYATVTTLKRKRLYANSTLENAVTTGGDILVVGGEVTTIGDIYALGTFPDEQRVGLKNRGGIIVGYNQVADDFLDTESHIPIAVSHLQEKGLLNITGQLETGTSVKLYNDGSQLTVSESVYADSFIVDRSAENTTTNIGKNLVLMDDLFVNGSHTTINVAPTETTAGNIIAMFDGMDVENPVTLDMELGTPDLSSSIRVNKKVTDISINMRRLLVMLESPILIFIGIQQRGRNILGLVRL